MDLPSSLVRTAHTLLGVFERGEAREHARKKMRAEQRRRRQAVFETFRRSTVARDYFVGVCQGVSSAYEQPIKKVMRTGVEILADDQKPRIKN